MKNYNQNFNIKSWAEDDRPREKLLAIGRQNLTDAELIAILMGSGSREETAVGLGQRILQSVNNDLFELSKLEVKDLTQFKGVGEAKAISIIAALELGRRRKDTKKTKKKKITCSADAYEVVKPKLLDLRLEEFWVILQDRAGHVIKLELISKGGVSGTIVDTRPILKSAIAHLASTLILVHNHPSGNLRPSAADIKVTKRISEAAKLLDMQVNDHLIVTDDGYYSFADEGML